MRLSSLLSAMLLAGVGAASTLGLAGCTTKTDVAPEVPCGTYATVRLCPGNTMGCLTEHTTLELADGTRLRPSGPAWDAYQPRQANGQVLHIGYTLGQALPAGEVGTVRARITCLEEAVIRCATPPYDGK